MKESKNKQIKRVGKISSSIRTKLILMCLLVSLVPLLLSGLINASISMKEGKRDAVTKINDRTQSIAEQVTAYVDKGYAVVEGLACGGDILSWDPDKQKDILVKAIENNPYFILFYQQKMDGTQTARSSGELGNRADRWWFIKEKEEQKPFVSKSYFTLSTNEAVTSIIFPVWNERNTMQGILAADMSLAKLQEIVDHYNTRIPTRF